MDREEVRFRSQDPIVRFIMEPTPEGFAALRCYLAGRDSRALAQLHETAPVELRPEITVALGAWLLAVLAIRTRLEARKPLTWVQVWATVGPAAERLRDARLALIPGLDLPLFLSCPELDSGQV